MCTSGQSCPEGATNPVLRCTLGELPSSLFNISIFYHLLVLSSFSPKLFVCFYDIQYKTFGLCETLLRLNTAYGRNTISFPRVPVDLMLGVFVSVLVLFFQIANRW